MKRTESQMNPQYTKVQAMKECSVGTKGTVPAGQTQHLTMKLIELTRMITNASNLYLRGIQFKSWLGH
jgi:hypothetical protein